MLDNTVSSDPMIQDQEESDGNLHQSKTFDAEDRAANGPADQEVEYATGWRFIAVGIAIVLSTFLVRHTLKAPQAVEHVLQPLLTTP